MKIMLAWLSGVATAACFGIASAAVWWLARAGYEVVRGVPDFVPSAWVQMEAGR